MDFLGNIHGAIAIDGWFASNQSLEGQYIFLQYSNQQKLTLCDDRSSEIFR